jgi:hypothetical protein
MRQQRDPITIPICVVEAFAKRGIDPEAKRNRIFEMTGMFPARYSLKKLKTN